MFDTRDVVKRTLEMREPNPTSVVYGPNKGPYITFLRRGPSRWRQLWVNKKPKIIDEKVKWVRQEKKSTTKIVTSGVTVFKKPKHEHDHTK